MENKNNKKIFNSREEFEKANELLESEFKKSKIDLKKTFNRSQNLLIINTLRNIKKNLVKFFIQESNSKKVEIDKKYEKLEEIDRDKLYSLKKENREIIEIISADLKAKIELDEIKINNLEGQDYIVVKNHKGEYIDPKSDDNKIKIKKFIINSNEIEKINLKLNDNYENYLKELKIINKDYQEISFQEDLIFLSTMAFENKKFSKVANLKESEFYYLPFTEENEDEIKETLKIIEQKAKEIKEKLKVEL